MGLKVAERNGNAGAPPVPQFARLKRAVPTAQKDGQLNAKQKRVKNAHPLRQKSDATPQIRRTFDVNDV